MALKRVSFATAHDASEFTSARWNFQPVPDGFGNAPIQLVEIAPGNPRFAYDPSTGEAEGLLIEEQRTFGALSTEINELLDIVGLVYSEGVANPLFDGQLTRVFNQSELNEIHGLLTSDRSIRGTNQQPNAFQLIIKPFGGLRYLRTSASDLNETIFDFEDEVVVEKNVGSGAQASIQKLIGYDGYYLVKYNIDRRNQSSGFIHRIEMLNGLLEGTFQGDNSVGFEIAYFGREYEKLNSSSPVLTTTTTVTRTADIVERTLGAEFNPNEGTFVLELEYSKRSFNSTGYLLFVGTSNDGFRINTASTGDLRTMCRLSGVTTLGNVSGSVHPRTGFRKFAISYSDGVVKCSQDGVPPESTAGAPARINGYVSIGSSVPELKVSLLKYEPRAYTDEQLQAASTL